MNPQISFEDAFEQMPLIAILRGITPDEAVAVVGTLYEAGFRIVEVTLNSPEPLSSIEILAQEYGERMLVGAGTVLTPDAVNQVADYGGRLIVSPNFNRAVVAATKARGMASCPGVQTVSEAFSALDAGADTIKIFPAEACPPPVIKAMRAVLPAQALIVPVGGINEDTMSAYWQVNCNGFGIGSNLYKTGKSLEQLSCSAVSLVRAMTALR